MSLETPTTEMVSLQVFVGQHRKLNWHPKAVTQTRVEHPEKPLRKKYRKLAWIWAPRVRGFGVDFLGDREKRAEKFWCDFMTEFVTAFVPKKKNWIRDVKTNF